MTTLSQNVKGELSLTLEVCMPVSQAENSEQAATMVHLNGFILFLKAITPSILVRQQSQESRQLLTYDKK